MPFVKAVYRRALFLLLIATPPFVLISAKVVAATPAPKGPSVAIKGFAFAPQVIVVKPGTTITWTNADEDPHTVTANDKSFHSAAMDSDDTFSFTFTRPGEFAYFCSLHPHMTGKVIVKG
jgi:plastocyanin